MENRLVHQLNALGTDVSLRRENLRNLFSSLSKDELRDLIKQSNEVDFRTDIVARLPVELRALIAAQVDKEDIINFLNVSRGWRQLWLQEDVMKVLADQWLPGFTKYHRLKEDITATKQDLPKLFHDAARRLAARSRGEFRSVFSHGQFMDSAPHNGLDKYIALDPEYHPPRADGQSPWLGILPSPADEVRISRSEHTTVLYSSGRVAWRMNSTELKTYPLIFVDDLRTRLRKVYTVPDLTLRGGYPRLLALGDKLLVVAVNRTLYAWHLETNQVRSVIMPMPTMRCTAIGNYIYIHPRLNMTAFSSEPGRDVYMWKFGEALLDLDTSPLDTLPRMNHTEDPYHNSAWWIVGILPHPLLETTVFVVCARINYNVVAVHEYTSGKYSCTYNSQIPKQEGLIILGLTIHKIIQVNAYGKFALRVEKKHARTTGTNQLFRVLCFDTLTTSFSIETYNSPPTGTYLQLNHTWWDQQITTFCPETLLSREDLDGPNSAIAQHPARRYIATADELAVSQGRTPLPTIPLHYTGWQNHLDGLLAEDLGVGVRKTVDVERRLITCRQNVHFPGTGRLFASEHPLQYLLQVTCSDDELERVSRADGSAILEQFLWADAEFIVFRRVWHRGYVVWRF